MVLRRLLPRRGPLPAPPVCAELRAAPPSAAPLTDGCAGCLAAGLRWTHLRLCLSCGHVGCCHSDRPQHARAHWQETGHPVMRSFQPGETWRWCYVHDLLG